MGLLLAFPGGFLVGDQRLLALCSGSFFVRPQARTQGLYLFKRYLSSPGYSFFFATTCNANSGALWRTLGGCAVPDSERGYLLPLRLEAVLPAFLTGRTSSRLAAGIARLVGRGADPVLKLLGRRARLTIEPCRDWEKLAALSRRHRCAHLITTVRGVPPVAIWPGLAQSPVRRLVVPRQARQRGLVLLGYHPQRTPGRDSRLCSAGCGLASGSDELPGHPSGNAATRHTEGRCPLLSAAARS